MEKNQRTENTSCEPAEIKPVTECKTRIDKIKKVALNAAIAAVGSVLVAIGQACITNNKE